MYKAFCYCCKKHVTTLDLKEFNALGHVNDRETAHQRYTIRTNRLPKDSELRLLVK